MHKLSLVVTTTTICADFRSICRFTYGDILDTIATGERHCPGQGDEAEHSGDSDVDEELCTC